MIRNTYDNQGKLVSSEDIPDDLVSPALSALLQSDMVALRCFKASIPFPEEWKDYVLALRSVVSGESEKMPEKPDFPKN